MPKASASKALGALVFHDYLQLAEIKLFPVGSIRGIGGRSITLA